MSERTERDLRSLRRASGLNTLLILLVGVLVVAPDESRMYIVPVGLFVCLFYLFLRSYIRE